MESKRIIIGLCRNHDTWPRKGLHGDPERVKMLFHGSITLRGMVTGPGHCWKLVPCQLLHVSVVTIAVPVTNQQLTV